MKKWMMSVAFLAMAHFAWSQFALSGKVIDAEQGQALPAASVVLVPMQAGTTTDLEGNFRFNRLKQGSYQLKVSYLGYKTQTQSVNLTADTQLEIRLQIETRLGDEVIVTATRASERTATTFTDVKKEALQKQNLGQDLPFLLNQTPSTVVNSDAGAGVGYTGIRIRGSDPTRINVTVNGIPLNDSESHGVFWVNMPDFASSVDNIQVQRGVGTSTNGAAAFGATVNIQTETMNPEAYGSIDNSIGSFNTRKHTFKAGSGLINDRFAFDARLSKIYSDGFVDRAFSDLNSFFISGGYYGKNTIVKANIFSGKEQTYQSWYGLPESKLQTDRTYNEYTYDNETDNYQQDHYQLIVANNSIEKLTLNAALHYTRGAGYYEQFRENDRLSRYGLPNLQLGDTVISRSDIIRRRWLDNHFYGFTFSADYDLNSRVQLVLGGGANRYIGDHFGEIIWARFAGTTNIRDQYYFNTAEKLDYNLYAKAYFSITEQLSAFADVQVRSIDYNYEGQDNDLVFHQGVQKFNFFNPKAGLAYKLNAQQNVYASYSVGNREPVRSDFLDAPVGQSPQHETLYNVEAGYRYNTRFLGFEANYFRMDYRNQLVLTGELNDVGASVRTNVDQSYRTGVELQAAIRPSQWLEWSGNLALSQNKITNFNEVIYNYFDNGDVTEEVNSFTNTDISFSPNVVAASTLTIKPINGLEISALSKYVGSQYLDNTSNASRQLDAFFVNDLRVIYNFSVKGMKRIGLSLLVNNILNQQYEPNGYTFSYGYEGQLYTENFYYPQAGTNFLAGMSLNF